MKKFLIFICSAAAFLFNGCSNRELIPVKMEKDAVLLDVRTPDEFHEKHIKGAINLPLDAIDNKIAEIVPDKNTPIYLYCRSGRRSKMAMGKLQQLGYQKITDFGNMSTAEKLLILP